MRDLELTCRPSHIIHGIYFLTFFSDMLVWHSIWHSFWYSIWHLFWYSFWHLSWHSIWHSILAFYLESILTFYSAILSGIHPGIHVACMLAFIMAFYRILSDSAFWHSPQWPVPTESWDLALASLRWRPAVPTEIWRSRLRSGGRKEGGRKEARKEEVTLVNPETPTWQVGNWSNWGDWPTTVGSDLFDLLFLARLVVKQPLSGRPLVWSRLRPSFWGIQIWDGGWIGRSGIKISALYECTKWLVFFGHPFLVQTWYPILTQI